MREVKPDSFMVEKDVFNLKKGYLKAFDFGIAKYI
jgi:hypothetical protein